MNKREKVASLVSKELDNIEQKASEFEWDARSVGDVQSSTFYDAQADTLQMCKVHLESFAEYLDLNSDDDATNQDFYVDGMIAACEMYVRKLRRILNKLREDYQGVQE